MFRAWVALFFLLTKVGLVLLFFFFLGPLVVLGRLEIWLWVLPFDRRLWLRLIIVLSLIFKLALFVLYGLVTFYGSQRCFFVLLAAI